MPAPYVPNVAIVTGAAQGIGYSIALRLADDGIDVAVNDIANKKEKLEEVAEEIKKKGRRSIVVTADVSREDEVKAMVVASLTQHRYLYEWCGCPWRNATEVNSD